MRLALPPISCKVYTPQPLAEAMIAALGDDVGLHWLEPSHGAGAFLEALARTRVNKERIVAIDLDPAPAEADRLATTYRGVDFLRWAGKTKLRFDRVVGNPPYVAIGQLPVSLRKTAAVTTDLAGRPIGCGANVWYAFVLASLRLLNHGGCLGFVLPSAAEFADYSASIRAAVSDHFERLELYRCTRPLFSSVQEGSIVAIARNFRSSGFRIMRRRFSTPSGLIKGLTSGARVSGRKCPAKSKHLFEQGVLFGNIANVRLGGVTGHAAYFLMSEEMRRSLKLPEDALTPVVSRARHLNSASINDEGWQVLKDAGQRVWLFNPPEAILLHPSVQRYLNRRLDGCNRAAYKVSIRTPWYRTPLPLTPHAFLSGMSQQGPWLCINEMKLLNATNTLYVVTFKEGHGNQRYSFALSLLTTTVRRQFRRVGRRYADGLVKYEPSAVSNIWLPPLKNDLDFCSLYHTALSHWLRGSSKKAMEIADSAVL